MIDFLYKWKVHKTWKPINYNNEVYFMSMIATTEWALTVDPGVNYSRRQDPCK